MKKFILALTAVTLLVGCTSTDMEGPNGSFRLKRTSLLQKHEIPKLEITTAGSNTTTKLEGYANDGGSAPINSAASFMGTAIGAGIKAGAGIAVPNADALSGLGN